jgi:hypothetical protein
MSPKGRQRESLAEAKVVAGTNQATNAEQLNHLRVKRMLPFINDNHLGVWWCVAFGQKSRPAGFLATA